MAKKLQLSLIMLAMVLLVVSCTPKQPAAAEEPQVAETPAVATEPVVDEVATDISDASNIDEELDTSELDSVDDILAEIENI